MKLTNKINVVSFLLKKPELKSYNKSFVRLIRVKTGRVVYFRFLFFCFFAQQAMSLFWKAGPMKLRS
jgi:hypothetical protein